VARLAVSLAAAAAVLLLAAACGGDDETADGDAAAPPPAGTEPDETVQDGCRPVEAPEPRQEGTETIPAALLDASATYEVDVVTSCGTFTITLDQEASPQTTASFVALAERGFYADTTFHRIVPGFVIQGGDPTGTGTGGPGYTTEDTPAEDTSYTRGVVAMAKTPQDPPGTAGSQFFIVTADDVGLPPEYAVIGTVTDGADVVERIAVLGDPNTELPTQPVVVERMEVRTT
jgi:peptidyl-prolyl cis-trans isomerase B (cyclophilin B)